MMDVVKQNNYLGGFQTSTKSVNCLHCKQIVSATLRDVKMTCYTQILNVKLTLQKNITYFTSCCSITTSDKHYMAYDCLGKSNVKMDDLTY